MTSNYNEIKILGKYRLDEICVDFAKDYRLEGLKEGLFLEETNEQVFPTLWDEAIDFGSDGYAAVKKDERWGFINAMGELVLPYRWKDVGLSQFCFPEGLCAVQDDQDLWGFINVEGEVILPCQWKECRDFRNGECAVKGLNDLWGAIDAQGNLVVPLEWDNIMVFLNGEAWVERNGNTYKIDMRGKVIESSEDFFEDIYKGPGSAILRYLRKFLLWIEGSNSVPLL